MAANDTSIEKSDTEPITTPLAMNRAIPIPINTHPSFRLSRPPQFRATTPPIHSKIPGVLRK
ncbi:MAG: hypothetical protein V7L25_21245 [Nostoc sp.]|uniref:hypothetical protein n=1 Tax=Nostoc sp. TaxID=1180 RepID=UPI002FF07594